jgi:ElaB protein
MNAIEKNSSDMNGNVQDTRQDLHHTIDKVASQVQPLVDKVVTHARDGVDQVGERIEQVSDSISKTSERVMARGKQLGAACQRAGETGRGYVRERPAMSLLIAAAAGYGLSKLLGSRK